MNGIGFSSNNSYLPARPKFRGDEQKGLELALGSTLLNLHEDIRTGQDSEADKKKVDEAALSVAKKLPKEEEAEFLKSYIKKRHSESLPPASRRPLETAPFSPDEPSSPNPFHQTHEEPTATTKNRTPSKRRRSKASRNRGTVGAQSPSLLVQNRSVSVPAKPIIPVVPLIPTKPVLRDASPVKSFDSELVQDSESSTVEGKRGRRGFSEAAQNRKPLIDESETSALTNTKPQVLPSPSKGNWASMASLKPGEKLPPELDAQAQRSSSVPTLPTRRAPEREASQGLVPAHIETNSEAGWSTVTGKKYPEGPITQERFNKVWGRMKRAEGGEKDARDWAKRANKNAFKAQKREKGQFLAGYRQGLTESANSAFSSLMPVPETTAMTTQDFAIRQMGLTPENRISEAGSTETDRVVERPRSSSPDKLKSTVRR